MRRITSLALTFDRESQVYPRDAHAAAQYGWEVVDPEAFPAAYRKEPGMSMRPPLSWELILLEGCLRAIPAFLSRRAPGDGARSEMTWWPCRAAGELDSDSSPRVEGIADPPSGRIRRFELRCRAGGRP